jgi:hypothetical protein
MKVEKRVLALFAAVAVTTTMAMAQTAGKKANDGKQELSVEESYLQESVETMVIREQSRSDSRDMKFVALEYISDAIEGGRAGEEIQKALEYMALEGVVNKTREGGVGRVINNFPDVRTKTAQYLGQVGGERAKDTLVRVLLAETEPMVLTEAIKSLAKIGLNENDEVVTTISWVATRFDVLGPDNTLALSALEAYEQIADKNGGIKDPFTVRTIVRIANNGQYIRPVQARAQDLLGKLRKYSVQSSKETTKESPKK